MRLELFNLIDDTLDIYQKNLDKYHHIRNQITTELTMLLEKEKECILDFQSRIKTKESLREKIIRNRYYLKFNRGEEIIASLSDVIGCRIDCRFLKDEQVILNCLKENLTYGEGNFKSASKMANLYLDVVSLQPQKQKNGLSIYRLDGYYIFRGEKINFELQIKSLVNSFWGSIEHKLVYKNNNYLDVDDFMSKMLVSINQSLNVLDAQLSIVHDQIQNASRKDLEFNERNIELLITKAINDLFSVKMRENLGFSLSIKYTSRILANYIFNKDVRHDTQGEDRIGSLLKILKKLSIMNIDFETKLYLESFEPKNKFQMIFGNYLLDKMNIDYDWYIFFKMLFAIEPGNNQSDFMNFLEIMEQSMIDEYWFKTSFAFLPKEDAAFIQRDLLEIFSSALIHENSIQIVADVTAKELNQIFRQFVLVIEMECSSHQDFLNHKTMYKQDWHNIAIQILNNNQ